MNITLIPREVRDMDSVLAVLMMIGVVIGVCVVVYLLCRHHHHERKAKKHAHHKH